MMLTPELMRQNNQAMVLTAIQENGPISRIELAQLLNLNPATITRITRTLIQEDLIKVEGEGESKTAGRKPVLLSFNHSSRLAVSIYIENNRITSCVADLAGHILSRRAGLSTSGLSPQLLISLVNDLLNESPGYRQRCTRICIGSDRLDLLGDEICDPLAERLGIPVLTSDAAALAAIGEACAGSMQNQPAFGLFYLGRHSGSALYLDGIVRSGQLGLTRDNCEASEIISEHGLLNLMVEPRPTSARAIFDAVRQGNTAAWEALEKIAIEIAFCMQSMASLLNLSAIVLAGAWVRAADLLIPLIQKHLPVASRPAPVILAAVLGDDAPLVGGIWKAVQTVGT